MKKATNTSPDRLVYQEMFEAILAQRLLPGTKLTEDELSKIFSVSRTVVRRALLRLSHDCIVDIRPNKGATVARPTMQEAREILEARRLVEGAIMRELTLKAPELEQGLDELRALVATEQESFNHDDRTSGIRISGDFHLRLAAISGNRTLTNILTRLVPQTSLVIAIYEKPGVLNCSHEEHFALIDAIASGDTAKAADLMDEHLIGIENKLMLNEDQSPADLQEVFAHLTRPR